MCNALIEVWLCGHFRFKEWQLDTCSKAQGCLEDRCRILGPRKALPGTGPCPDSTCKGHDGKAKKMVALPIPVSQHPPLPEAFWDEDPLKVLRTTIYVGIEPDELATVKPEGSPVPWKREENQGIRDSELSEEDGNGVAEDDKNSGSEVDEVEEPSSEVEYSEGQDRE